MLSAGARPGAQDRRELSRMAAEKIQAWQESTSAMAAQLYKAQMQWTAAAMRNWLALWTSPWGMPGRAHRFSTSPRQGRAAHRRLERTLSEVIGRGLAPVHRRATANARRLSRRKR